MRINFAKKLKIFLIAVLVILVAGMTMLGVLGFNQTVDYKASFEMQVSVDQIAGESVSILKNSTEKAFTDNSITPVDYSMQEMKDGSILIYKFNNDVSDKAAVVKKAVEDALVAGNLSGVGVEVKVYQNVGNFYSYLATALIALSISVAVIFVYALIMNKLAGGVAVLCSSVLSVLLFIALMALTRIPAQPYLSILAGASLALTSALSLVLTNAYKVASKTDAKLCSNDIAENVCKSYRALYIIMAIAILALAVIIGAVGFSSSLFLALAVLVAGVSSLASAVFMTPFIWSIIKGKKK